MGGLFSSSAPPRAEAEAPAPSPKSSSRRGRGKKGRKARTYAEVAAAMADSDDGGPAAAGPSPHEQRVAQLRLIPMKLELAWQETDRLEGLLHKWGGTGVGVAKARVSMAGDLAMAFKNIERLDQGGKKGGKSVSLRDEPEAASALDSGAAEPNEFDWKRTKRLVKKLRTACKAGKPLKLPRVADPWGDEDPAWRAKFVEERGTALMVVLDGLDLHGSDMLRAQRKAIYRLLELLSKQAADWAAAAAEAPKAAPAAAAATAPAPAPAESAATPAPAASAAAPEEVPDRASEPAPEPEPAVSADGWTTVQTKKKRRKPHR